MSYFDDWSDDNGDGGNSGFGSDQTGGLPDNPYFQVKADGPFAGWSNYAMDNLKGSLSPMDYGKFLQDRIGTYGANRMIQDPNEPPAQFDLHYDPADYGAPAAGQANDSGQMGGTGAGEADAVGSGPGGWFTNQGRYPNQNPMLGPSFAGQTGRSANPGNGRQATGWSYPRPLRNSRTLLSFHAHTVL